jgi:hypothetical protein
MTDVKCQGIVKRVIKLRKFLLKSSGAIQKTMNLFYFFIKLFKSLITTGHFEP